MQERTWMRKMLAVMLALCLLLSGTVMADVALEEEVQQSVEQEVVTAETGAEPEATAEAGEPTPEVTEEPEATEEPETTAEAGEPTSEVTDEPETTADEDAPMESAGQPMRFALRTAETCAHDNVDSWSAYMDVEYSVNGQDGHTMTGYPCIGNYCPDCGESWSDKLSDEKVSETQPHTFADGVCMDCGYENTCKHGKSESWTRYEDAEYSANGQDDHTVTGYLYIEYYCPDCGDSWSEKSSDEKVSETQPHEFGSGKCRYCGYENTCTHDNVDSWTMYEDAVYSVNGQEGHTVTGYPCTGYFCPDCEESWHDEPGDEKVSVIRHHEFMDGVCVDCGYENTCAHDNVDSWTEYMDAEYSANGQEGHTVTGYPFTVYFCLDCDECWNDEPGDEKVSETQSHRYENGVCENCGYENTCTHDRIDSWTEYMDAEYSANGQEGHTVTGYPFTRYYCPDCDEMWDGEPGDEKGSEFRTHAFENGVCEDCGYVNTCAHDRVDSWTEYADAEYSSNGQSGHIVTGYPFTRYYCPDCDEMWDGEPGDEKGWAIWGHVFENGVCVDCGHQNTCAHEFTYEETWYSDAEYSGGNAQGHTVTGYKVVTTTCGVCYEIIDEAHERQITSGTESHQFEDGVCTKCGYANTCDHPKKRLWTFLEDSVYTSVSIEEHDETGYKVTGYDCLVCGETWIESKSDTLETIRYPHGYQNGKCEFCGYESGCAHENTVMEELPYYTGELKIVPVNDKLHGWTGPKARNTVCLDCGEVISQIIISANEQFTEEHWYDDGEDFCAICGYDKPKTTVTPAPTMPTVTDTPSATPTPTMPTVTDEPVYEEVAADEAVHGVKAEDATPMVDTMMAVAEALETQSEVTTIKIVNIEKVILPEEKEALEQLPVHEQLLTFLSVIGFEAQVTAAMEASDTAFSPEAELLKNQIQSRIEAMDEAAYAEFEAMLLESFPQETIEIDGMEYSFFVLELEVRMGDEVRYERYGFRREGEEWIFTRLEIGA